MKKLLIVLFVLFVCSTSVAVAGEFGFQIGGGGGVGFGYHGGHSSFYLESMPSYYYAPSPVWIVPPYYSGAYHSYRPRYYWGPGYHEGHYGHGGHGHHGDHGHH